MSAERKTKGFNFFSFPGERKGETKTLNSHRADAVLGRDPGGLVRVELVLLSDFGGVEEGREGEKR